MAEGNTQLADWISVLTRGGYNLLESNGFTARHEPGEEYWNSNYPMVHMHFHFRHFDPKKKNREVVLTSYASNNSYWTTYGSAFSGKALMRRFGITVTGTKETEISTLDDLRRVLNIE